MDLHRAAASLVCIGFEGLAAPEPALDLVGQGVSGAILFRRNIAEPEQVAGLCASLKRAAGRRFLLSVDQEGGRVARLRDAPFTAVPTMREIGERGDEALARDVGRLLGREVRAAGFDMDFAPVLDVDTNPANPVICRAIPSRSRGSASPWARASNRSAWPRAASTFPATAIRARTAT